MVMNYDEAKSAMERPTYQQMAGFQPSKRPEEPSLLAPFSAVVKNAATNKIQLERL